MNAATISQAPAGLLQQALILLHMKPYLQ